MKCLSTLALSLLALGTGLLPAKPSAAQPPHMLTRLNVPVESPGIPAYVRLENFGVGWVAPRNRRWTALVFYRDPACVPAQFNLGQFFDFPGPGGLGALACPSLVEGHYLYAGPANPSAPPTFSVLRNRTLELPVWFVSSQELDRVLALGHFTIGDIAALPSLLRGRAWQFNEQLVPAGPGTSPGMTMSASGRLDNGARFSFFWHNYPARNENVFDLEFSRSAPPAAQGGR